MNSTTKNAVFEAFPTSIRSFISVTKLALMADWCTESPTACLLVKLCKSTCFIGSPTIITLGGCTSGVRTEEANKNFVKYTIPCTHI